jgi:hypothetical protein
MQGVGAIGLERENIATAKLPTLKKIFERNERSSSQISGSES